MECNIQDLISAGESIIENRKKICNNKISDRRSSIEGGWGTPCSTNLNFSRNNSSGIRSSIDSGYDALYELAAISRSNELSSISKSNEVASLSKSNMTSIPRSYDTHIQNAQSFKSDFSTVENTKDNTAFETTISSSNLSQSFTNYNIKFNESFKNSSRDILKKVEADKKFAEKNEFSQSDIFDLKKEFSVIFSSAHHVLSSLSNAVRMLKETNLENCSEILSPNVENRSDIEFEINSLKEISSRYDQNFLEYSRKVSDFISQIDENYQIGREKVATLERFDKKSRQLLKITNELVDKTGIRQILPNTSRTNRENIENSLNEIELRLNILLSENCKNLMRDKIEQLQITESELNKFKNRLKQNDFEHKKIRHENEEKILKLQNDLDQKLKIIKMMPSDFKYLRSENEAMERSHKAQIDEIEAEKISLNQRIYELATLEREAKSETERIKNSLSFASKNFDEGKSDLLNKYQKLDESNSLLQSQIEKQMTLLKRTNEKWLTEKDKLNSIVLKQQLEIKDLKQDAKSGENFINEEKKFSQKLKNEIEVLLKQIERLKNEREDEYRELEEKFDTKMAEICEKNSEIRKFELNLSEISTELEIERAKRATALSDVSILTETKNRLENKLKILTKFCPKDVRIKFGFGDVGGAIDFSDEISKLTDQLSENQKRVSELSKILKSKESEIEKIKANIRIEMENKYKQLEKIQNSASELEYAIHLNSKNEEFLETPANRLKDAEYFESLMKNSEKLSKNGEHFEKSGNNLLNSPLKFSKNLYTDSHSDVITELTNKLKEAKLAAKKAREEARKDRVECAKLRQKITLLEIDLECAREAFKNKKMSIEIQNKTENELFESQNS